MDSITQALLGATVHASLLGRWQGRKALLYGAVLGTLPDLDVVIDYGDAVADMTYHRGFSHSLLVLSLLAVALAWLARKCGPTRTIRACGYFSQSGWCLSRMCCWMPLPATALSCSGR